MSGTWNLLGDRLEHWARSTPDARAISFDGVDYTWAQWLDRIQRLTGALRAAGIGHGDRVAFVDKNHIGGVEATFAAAALGAANVVVNWRLATEELEYVLNHSGAKLVFHGAESPIEKDRLPAVEKLITVGGDADEYEPLLKDSVATQADPSVEASDCCLVLYSSGTTGRPKGVMLSHRSLIEHTVHTSGDFPFEDGDVNLVAMPLFHVGGSSYVQVGIDAGVPSYLARDADGPTLFGAVAAGATHAFLVPAVVGAVFAAGDAAVAALGRLKYFVYGASPMPLPLLRKALAAWPEMNFQQVYGMTEMAGVVTALRPAAHRDADHPERLASAGTVVDGVEMRVVDPATGVDVPVGQPGELWFRSTQVMNGYLDNREATAETITEDGWLRSGDIGWCDAEGFVTISDRVKDMIITGGENVYSPEVERVLAEHAAVADVAVIGIPDDRWGESIKAIITLAPGQSLSESELIEWTRERLAGFKCPRSVDILDELPRNPTGKILKRTLREKYWTGRGKQV